MGYITNFQWHKTTVEYQHNRPIALLTEFPEENGIIFRA